MSEWLFYNPNPCHKNVGDCTVRAVSRLFNIDWSKAFCLLNAVAFELCDMPSSNEVLDYLLRHNNYSKHIIPQDSEMVYTIGDFCEDNPKGKYILCTGTHVVCAIDGIIYDSWDSRDKIPLYFYKKE